MALSMQDLQQMLGRGAGAAGLGAGLGGLFSRGRNPADAASRMIGQIPGQTNQYYDPFFQAGKSQLPGLEQQYGSLMNDPGSKLNEIGSHYQQSPGFQFALQQALGGAGHAAAAGGMAGSPQHEQQNMGVATGLANQDYNNWRGQATGLYQSGLGGSQNLAQMGAGAGQSQADMISQALAQQGNLAYQGQKYKNENNPWGNILGGAGMLAAFL
jgi:hypothetical protein